MSTGARAGTTGAMDARRAWRTEVDATTRRRPPRTVDCAGSTGSFHGPAAEHPDNHLVSRAPITIRILRTGSRSEELLGCVARRFGSERLRSDGFGAVHVDVTGRPAATWDQLRDVLDAAGSDWRQWLHLPPRPSGRGT